MPNDFLRPSPDQMGLRETNKGSLRFTVPDAVNPYAHALQEAGLPKDHPECMERKEVTVDVEQIINKQVEHYRDQNLPIWAEDIENNKGLLLNVLSDEEEKKKIEKRIQAGMIPIVMPSRETQARTWEQSLNNLEPVWIKDGEQKSLQKSYIQELYAEKMTSQFFDSLPDRPYLVWTTPSKKVDSKTTGKTFDDQKNLLLQLHIDNPDLVDSRDISPVELAALQSLHTIEIVKKAQETETAINNIVPLDEKTSTRLVSLELFSDGEAPDVHFDPRSAQMYFNRSSVGPYSDVGFRTVARS